MWQCPTLVALRRFHSFDENLLFNDPRMKYISIAERKRWETRTAAPLRGRTKGQREKEKVFMANAMATILQMKKAALDF